MFKPLTIYLLLLILFLTVGCGEGSELPGKADSAETITGTEEPTAVQSGPMQMGGGGMMARHHAEIPQEYAGMTNPISADDDSLLRGAEIYGTYCASCHGDGGMGDGPAGGQLDPAPAPLAHTSRMLGDDYLFWRISEGGGHEPFSSAMPRWQDVLDDAGRWDTINYIRALASGVTLPAPGPQSGATFDPQEEALRHAQMAEEGVLAGVLSQSEADAFIDIHAQLDAVMSRGDVTASGGMEAMQQALLQELVAAGVVTQTQVDLFNSAHEKLLQAGLMQ